MPLILPGNVASATASTTYDVANSCRFDDGDSAYMHKTPGGAGNRRTFTFSAWIKRGTLGAEMGIFTAGADANSGQFFTIMFTDADALNVQFYEGGFQDLTTNRVFRDVSAWYNIIVAVDTTQGTEANRIKIYVNGTQESSFASSDYPSQNWDSAVNNSEIQQIGVRRNGSGALAGYYDGYIAEAVLVDGTQQANTDIGEFDDDSPMIWKPIDVSGLTFGTNGFYCDYEASDNLGNDANGGTDLTEVNLAATDQCVDSPTNNFCTFTTTHPSATSFTITEGGTRVSKSGSGNVALTGSSLMPTAGKWYFEALINEAGNGDRTRVGVVNYQTVKDYTGVINTPSQVLAGCTTSCKGAKHFEGDGSGSGSVTEYTASGDFADDDVVNFAMDLDNKAIYIGRNNTWHTQTASSGGDPTSGASKTGAITTDTTIMNGDPMSIMFGHSAGVSDGSDISFNFGNPAYALTSAANDENGYGNFEYAPPSGFLALCTKNLGSDGG